MLAVDVRNTRRLIVVAACSFLIVFSLFSINFDGTYTTHYEPDDKSSTNTNAVRDEPVDIRRDTGSSDLENVECNAMKTPRYDYDLPRTSVGTCVHGRCCSASGWDFEPGNNPPCLVFIHIPKSGGTQFRRWLGQIMENTASNFGGHYILPGDYNAVTELPPPQWLQCGHWTGKMVNMKRYSSCKFVTVLREPIERVESAFTYMGHVSNQWESCMARGPCAGTWDSSFLVNDAVRQLAGYAHWNRMNYSAYLPSSLIHAEMEGAAIWEEYLLLAKYNLAKMDYVCMQSSLLQCARRIALDYGVNPRIILPERTNVQNTTKVHEKNETIKNMIIAANSWDLKLWEDEKKMCTSTLNRYRCTGKYETKPQCCIFCNISQVTFPDSNATGAIPLIFDRDPIKLELSLKLKSKFILFIGDSVDRELFQTICEVLGLPYIDLELNSSFVRWSACGGLAHNDTIVMYSLSCGSGRKPYFTDCHTANSPNSGNGLLSWGEYDTLKHLQSLEHIFKFVGRESDVTILNFGLWDLASEWEDRTVKGSNELSEGGWFNSDYIDRYHDQVAGKISFLRKVSPKSAIFFRSIGPIRERLLPRGILQTRLRPEYAERLAEEARHIDIGTACFINFYDRMIQLDDSENIDAIHITGKAMLLHYFLPLLRQCKGNCGLA